MLKNHISKWWFDATLFIGFLLAFFLDLTGLELHQWIGMAAIGLAGYHLFVHAGWVSAVTDRFFGGTSAQARLYYLIDAFLLIGFSLIALTGLLISTWLNFSMVQMELWVSVHIQASVMTLALTVIKIAAHWRWVVGTARKIFTLAPQPAPRLGTVRPPVKAAVQVSANQSTNRRDFLKLMGAVGAASALALSSALTSLGEASGDQAGSEADTDQNQTDLSHSLKTLTTSQSCSVQCNRRCSFPGHCRRYTDSNGNNRCDLGECA
jgi:hypothetical protein